MYYKHIPYETICARHRYNGIDRMLYNKRHPSLVTLLNPVRSRSGKTTFGTPTSRAAAIDMIRTTYKDELNYLQSYRS